MIRVCWFGGPMTPNRIRCLAQMRATAGVPVEVITEENLPIVPEFPLHPAFPYLSATHKADYIRTYIMHVHGGGYCDIKEIKGSWVRAFEELNDPEAWIVGYPEEQEGDVAYIPNRHLWRSMVGNGAYICRPRTPLTEEWFSEMNRFLDEKLESLRAHPAQRPDDRKEWGPYPIEWNEMLGRIFQRVLANYLPHVRQTLPGVVYWNYR